MTDYNSMCSLREKFPKWGGRLKKTDENFQFQFGNFENPGRGGGVDFSKMSELLIRLRPNPRKENRKLNMAFFSMQICLF